MDNGQASYGFILRNALGEILTASAKSLGDHPSILIVEAMGLVKGIKGAISLHIKKIIIIEGDNITVINSIKANANPLWSIANIIVDARSLLEQFDQVYFHHCYRKANRAVDFMAHKGHFYSDVLFWSPPYCIDFFLLIHKDVLGWLSG